MPWSDEAVLARARSYALTALRQRGPVQAWIVDDTGFPKKGTHSVGVVRRYCGQVGKQENCRVAVSLSVNTDQASLGVCRSSVATALNNLAELLRDKGNDAGAEPLFLRALAIREKALVQTTLRRG